MARRINSIAFRLGASSWWQTRTPPKLAKDKHLEIINKVTTGVFQKFGYFVSDILLNRSINQTGNIVLLGNSKSAFKFRRFSKPLYKRLRSYDYRFHVPALLKEKEKRRNTQLSGRLVSLPPTSGAWTRPKVYLFAFIDQILKKYLNFNYQFSFRKLKKSFSNANIFSSYLTGTSSQRGLASKVSVLRMIKRSIRYMRKEKYRRFRRIYRRRKSHKFFKDEYRGGLASLPAARTLRLGV